MSPGQLRFAVAILEAASIPVIFDDEDDARKRIRRLDSVQAPVAIVKDGIASEFDNGPVINLRLPLNNHYLYTTWDTIWQSISLGHVAHGEYDEALDYIHDRITEGPDHE